MSATDKGKTHKARMEHPNAFINHQNKWWDGYAGEDVVILDDMDDPCLKHYMKLWADKWSCKGETKGGYTWSLLSQSEFIYNRLERGLNIIERHSSSVQIVFTEP